jgi:hypothetical protein
MFFKKATTVPWRPVRISLNLKAQIIARALETANRRENSPTAPGENSHHKAVVFG